MDHYLTVGRLREQLADLPDDMPVYYERIEDSYFERGGWDKTVLNVPDDHYPEDATSQYTRAFCGFRFGENFCITAHY